jgi:hypothetical protein
MSVTKRVRSRLVSQPRRVTCALWVPGRARRLQRMRVVRGRAPA